MDDDAVWHTAAFCKLVTQGVALRVGKVLSPQQGVAEGQPRRDAVFPRQGKDFFGVMLPEASPSPAPDAVGRCAVDGADVSPVINVFSVRPEQRQELPVQLVELKQPGQVKIRFSEFHDQSSSRILSFSTTQPAMVASAAKEAMAPVMCSLYQPNSYFGDGVPSCDELIVETLL